MSCSFGAVNLFILKGAIAFFREVLHFNVTTSVRNKSTPGWRPPVCSPGVSCVVLARARLTLATLQHARLGAEGSARVARAENLIDSDVVIWVWQQMG